MSVDRFTSPIHAIAFYLVKSLHLSITVFVVFGWLFPYQYVLMVHAVLVPLLILHWRTYHDRCVLSDIEAWLQGVTIESQEDAPFIRGLLRLFTKREFENRIIARITYGVMGSVFLASCIRLYLDCFGYCPV